MSKWRRILDRWDALGYLGAADPPVAALGTELATLLQGATTGVGGGSLAYAERFVLKTMASPSYSVHRYGDGTVSADVSPNFKSPPTKADGPKGTPTAHVLLRAALEALAAQEEAPHG